LLQFLGGDLVTVTLIVITGLYIALNIVPMDNMQRRSQGLSSRYSGVDEYNTYGK
jgi:hypothetical protein